MRIEICGGIAAGKTTLAQLLSQLGIVGVLEDFQSNPFWKPFYADPAGTAFETEISFLLQHYHEIKAAAKRGATFVCDFSLLLDLAYAHVTLSGGKQSAFINCMQRDPQGALAARAFGSACLRSEGRTRPDSAARKGCGEVDHHRVSASDQSGIKRIGQIRMRFLEDAHPRQRSCQFRRR